MRRINVSIGLLLLAATAGCGSDSTDANPPGGGRQLPPNGISIVLGAQTKGTAAFTPNPLSVSLAGGGLVQWFNDDRGSGVYGTAGVTHNIIADDGSFNSGNLAPGASFQATLTTAGDHGYHCSIHPTMRGTVSVTP